MYELAATSSEASPHPIELEWMSSLEDGTDASPVWYHGFLLTDHECTAHEATVLGKFSGWPEEDGT